MKIIISESQFEKILTGSGIKGNLLPLIPYWKQIEEKTGKEITLKNLIDEFEISGGIKSENNGYENSALKAFSKLQEVCPNLKMDVDSYRTYQKQTDLFIEYVKKYGSIEGAMKKRTIPGFSQHHTGRAFDIEPKELRDCVVKNAKKFGFIFPYVGQTSTRVSEPWHIYYNE